MVVPGKGTQTAVSSTSVCPEPGSQSEVPGGRGGCLRYSVTGVTAKGARMDAVDVGRFVKLERDIRAAERGGIGARWEFGRDVLAFYDLRGAVPPKTLRESLGVSV